MPAQTEHNPFPQNLGDMPDVYASQMVGSEMEPEIPDGSAVIMSQSAPVRPGDLVCIYKRPEFVGPGEHRAVVNKLVMPPGVDLPFDPHPQSEVVPLIVARQTNPPRTLLFDASKVQAMHRCFGSAKIAKNGFARLPQRLMNAIEESRQEAR